MNKEQMITEIYSVVANKKFCNWCKIVYRPKATQWYYKTRKILSTKINSDLLYVEHWYHYFTPQKILREQITKVIWHPVLIWDVLNWLEEYNKTNIKEVSAHRIAWLKINKCWEDKLKPIENQSIQCIIYIFNLIKNESKKPKKL